MPNVPDQTQFDYLYDALTQKFPGLTGDQQGTSVFQFATAPIPAVWQTGNDAQAYDVANAVPDDVTGFYTPGDNLDSAYQDLITSVKPANYSENAAYTQQLTLINALQASILEASDDANSAYQEWAANNQNADGTPAESKNAWLVDPLGGLGWGDKLSALESQYDLATGKLAAITASMDAALARAQKAALTDTMPISRAGGKAIMVPSVTIDGDLGSDLARWAQYPPGQYDFQVQITGDYTVKSPWKTLYTTTVKQDCWETSASVNVDTSRIITDVNYKLEVVAVGLEAYKITRGAWYDADYVNPKVQITPGATVTNDTFFGFDGSLHLIPSMLLVMYRPTIKLTISTETYKQQFEANADADIDWVDLFSFRFKFDGLASLQPVDNGDGTSTVTFASPQGASPQIIGVVSKNTWNGHEPGPAAKATPARALASSVPAGS